ncbi:hypothetical protein Scep_010879 [Stephania cephalantha]|uniref:Uncharacterized protein n=1 Tax=Stephania cephalantha TaxID=152367 RepID=A0AAP0JX88_9MAGN
MCSTNCSRLIICLSIVAALIALTETRAHTLDDDSLLSHPTLGRNLLERNNVTKRGKDLGDTVRVDPLNKLKKYRGGYDITNKHYWSSVVYTGIYGYAIGALWLLFGVLCGGFILFSLLFRDDADERKLKKKVPCSRQCYFWPVFLGTSFTILAIIACGVVLGGSSRFHSRAKTVVNIIIETADGASDTMFNVTGSMRNIQENLSMSNNGGDEVTNFLNRTSQRLDREATKIRREARKNRRLIDKGLRIIYAVSTVAFSLTLAALIALSISGFLKSRRTLCSFIVFCWILAVLCWIFFGLYFFLDKFAGDTCTALRDFQNDPKNNSLSSIVPCNELQSAKSLLFDTRAGIYGVINEVNANISSARSSPVLNLVRICNPLSGPPEYNYRPDNCPPNTIKIGDIPKLLKMFTCNSSEGGSCRQGEFITAEVYRIVEAYTSSLQDLLDALPNMESLVDCRIVKDAFTRLISTQCKPLKRYARIVWISAVTLSTLMVVLILVYTFKACHDRKRHFSDGSSVKPHLPPTDKLGPDKVDEAYINHSVHKLDA